MDIQRAFQEPKADPSSTAMVYASTSTPSSHVSTQASPLFCPPPVCLDAIPYLGIQICLLKSCMQKEAAYRGGPLQNSKNSFGHRWVLLLNWRGFRMLKLQEEINQLVERNFESVRRKPQKTIQSDSHPQVSKFFL